LGTATGREGSVRHPSEGTGAPEPPRSLGEPELTYRTLVEGVPSTVLYIDATDDASTNLYTSPQTEDVLGVPAAEWMADPTLWPRLVHPDDLDRVMAENRESNVTGRPFISQYRIRRPDGREVWIHDEAILVRDEQGRPQFWRGVMIDITQQKRIEEKLRQSLDILRRTMQERRRLLSRLEEAEEQERRRIAADIHDDSIQVMSSVDVRLQMLLAELENAQHQAMLEGIHNTVQLAIERLRHLLFELRPPALDREGLVAALRVCLEENAREPGFSWEIDDRLKDEPPDDVRATMYRIVQEAITNVRKHAQATHVVLEVGPSDGGIGARLVDDGTGFDPEAIHPEPGHLGLATMAERAEVSGGWCRVESSAGAGTTVACWIPLEVVP